MENSSNTDILNELEVLKDIFNKTNEQVIQLDNNLETELGEVGKTIKKEIVEGFSSFEEIEQKKNLLKHEIEKTQIKLNEQLSQISENADHLKQSMQNILNRLK